jgi:ABC-type Na+ efflux pump permease subunit
MRKVLTIAVREYGAMVGTKAFLVSMTLMPLLMFGGIVVARFMDRMPQVGEKRFVIVDATGGELFKDLERAAATRNETVAHGDGSAAQYSLEQFSSPQLSDADRITLSERVRNDELKAFVEIPAALLDPAADATAQQARYYAPNAMLAEERRWLEQALTETVTARRLAALSVDPAAVLRATAPVPLQPLGLFKKTAEGEVSSAPKGGGMAAIFVPAGFMFLMFMVVLLSAQPLLEGVMEEKNNRIAEVLLGSVSASQLMLGKLLGNIAGALSAIAIYAAGGYAAARYNGWTDLIPTDLVPWFLAFQTLGVLMFGSIFLAIGAAVTQSKEAQSLLLPIWLLIALPLFGWLQIVRDPNGAFAVWSSFFPPSAPLVMTLRLASDAVVPLWQILLSLIVLSLATAAGVFLAGRVFRVGILWQGKSPKVSELLRWALRS